MSDLRSAIRNLVRQEYQKTTGGPSGNRLGVVNTVNADGTAAIMVDGQLLTATTLYPCVPGQQVIVMPAGGIYKAAPISPNAPAVEIIHPPFFSGRPGGLRVAAIFFASPTAPPANTNGGYGIYLQQQGDSNIYFINFGVAPFNNPALINLPASFSPNGRYLALGIPDPASSLQAGCIDLGTQKFSSTSVLDPVKKVYDITDKVNLVTLGQVIWPTPLGFGTSNNIIAADNAGSIYPAAAFTNVFFQEEGAIAKIVKGSFSGFPFAQATQDFDSGFFIFTLGSGDASWALWDPAHGIIAAQGGTFSGFSFIQADNTIYNFLGASMVRDDIRTTGLLDRIGILVTDDFRASIMPNPSDPTARVLYSSPFAGGPVSRCDLVGLDFWVGPTGTARHDLASLLTYSDFTTLGDGFIMVTKANKFCLNWDAGDLKPRLYKMTGDLAGTLTKSGTPEAGFSPGQADPAIVRLLDEGDIGCDVFTWAAVG